MKPDAYFLGWALIGISGLGIVCFFAVYPFLCWWKGRNLPVPQYPAHKTLPFISVISVMCNGEKLVQAKVENFLAWDYPEDRREMILFGDGPQPETRKIVERLNVPRVRYLEQPEHEGKAFALNKAVEHCQGEILIFSDADALPVPEAAGLLVIPFADPQIGGVCGQRRIARDKACLEDAQGQYIKLDSQLKLWESRISTLSSNDGKLYAIRKSLFQPILPYATDDLYNALSIIGQGYRFIFEHRAVAEIRVPSRNLGHEIRRRRRIVNRSLQGIFHRKKLLNPLRFGFFSFGLVINKVLRRLLPVALLMLLLGSLLAGPYSWLALALLLGQVAFYLAGILGALSEKDFPLPGKAKKICQRVCYFCIGNMGMLLGVYDFLCGKKTVKWTPLKGNPGT